MTLSVGDHDLEVKRGDLVVKTCRFAVRRGENEPLRIEFEPKATGIVGGMMGGGMMGGGMMRGGMMGGGSKDSAPTGPQMGGMMGGGMMGGGSEDPAPTGRNGWDDGRNDERRRVEGFGSDGFRSARRWAE